VRLSLFVRFVVVVVLLLVGETSSKILRILVPSFRIGMTFRRILFFQ